MIIRLKALIADGIISANNESRSFAALTIKDVYKWYYANQGENRQN